MLKDPFRKILIIQTAFIGDVILATSVVEKLASFYPDATIDFLLRKGNEGLLVNNPHISKVLIWDKKKDKNRNLFRMIGRIRHEHYDLVVNLQRFLSTGLFTAFSGSKVRAGFDKNPLSFSFGHKVKHEVKQSGGGLHEIGRNHLLIQPYTDDIPVKPKLYPSAQDYAVASGYKQQPYICIAPASVWYTKQYPMEKWIELINALPEKYNVYLLGSGQDKGLCAQIMSQVKRKGVTELCGKLSFLESAALMKDAVMNYVNDSAPMHIASSMNAPVCAVFCSTVPSFGFGPLSDRSYVVQVAPELSCRPCGLHGHKKCPEGHFRCGYDIDLRQLLSAIGQ